MTKDEVFDVELSVDEGRQLLDALALGPDKRRLRVRRLEHGMAFAAACIAMGAPLLTLAMSGLGGGGTGVWMLFAGPLSAYGFGRLVHTFVQPAPLDVGADGIAWKDMLGTAHFVPHRDVVSIDLKKSPYSKKDTLTHLILTTVDDVYEIELGPVPPSLAAAVRARIAQAQGKEGDPLPLLDRRGVSAAAWRQKLRALVGEGDYREAKVPRVRVASVLEDPHAASKQRLAAAIALIESHDPRTQEFGRKLALSIAPSLADESLALALEHVARGDLEDDTLEAMV